MAPPKGFDSFSSILDAVAERLGIRAKLLEQRLRRDWVEIVGEQVAAHTRPEQIRYRKLSVLVDHSVWMQQLAFLKPDLLRQIRVSVGEDLVQDLLFRIGDLSRIPLPGPDSTTSRMDPAPEPSPQIVQEVAGRTSRILDPELRARFTAVIAKALVTAQPTREGDR
ncbi:MAG TPA: DUF721 domain-containing protein [Nitrospiraceae bacterium]|nr:DUF721 domain-containing protein [Nitrospiraceae bacterium]